MILADKIIELRKKNGWSQEELAEKMNVSPEECLVFEDIPYGIMAGKQAGMHVCAVEDVYSVKDREEKLRLADFYIDNYEELL